MLVTSLCWWLYDGDRFEMLVAESLCWWLFSLCWWFSLCIKSVTNILNRSPTSQTCHQLIWSPTSVTNIDVTIWKLSWSIFSNFIQARWCSRFAFNHTRSITFCVRSCIYTRKTTNFRLLLWRLFIYYNVILSLWKWWHLRAAHFSAHNLLVNFD